LKEFRNVHTKNDRHSIFLFILLQSNPRSEDLRSSFNIPSASPIHHFIESAETFTDGTAFPLQLFLPNALCKLCHLRSAVESAIALPISEFAIFEEIPPTAFHQFPILLNNLTISFKEKSYIFISWSLLLLRVTAPLSNAFESEMQALGQVRKSRIRRRFWRSQSDYEDLKMKFPPFQSKWKNLSLSVTLEAHFL